MIASGWTAGESMRRFDAIVIGGGLIGTAIGHGLARAGLTVVLLDEGDIAYRASRGNFGLVLSTDKGPRRAALSAFDAALGRGVAAPCISAGRRRAEPRRRGHRVPL
jgi:glycine/D-amino acid oxidase-like deaminating enzyme